MAVAITWNELSAYELRAKVAKAKDAKAAPQHEISTDRVKKG